MSNSSEVFNNPKAEKLQPSLPGNISQITHPKFDDIVNPELRKIAKDVLDAARLSFTTVVANQGKSTMGSGTTEAALAKVVQQFTPEKRTNAELRAQTLLDSDYENKKAVFGRFADTKINLSEGSNFQQFLQSVKPEALNLVNLGFKEKVTTQFDTALKEGNLDSLIDSDRFAEVWGGPVRHIDKMSEASGNSLARVTSTSHIQLILTSLRCNDETDFEWGDDEMAVAGIAIGEKGVVTQINEKSAGGGYKNDVERQLDWNNYANFNLTETNQWPKKFGVSLILAEKDNGSLASFIQNMWNNVRETVNKWLEEAAKAAGVIVAKFLGMEKYAAQIGQVIAGAVKDIVEKVVRFLIELFGDEIFTPATVWADLPNISTRWGGSASSPIMSETFNGHGGQYQLNYQWQLTGVPGPVTPPDPIKQYKIMVKHSGMCLNVAGASMEGAAVIQWPWAGGQGNELWQFESVEDGYYKIVAKHSGKCLDIQGGYQWEGVALNQWGYWGGDNQKFRLELVSDGYYKIIAKHSGKCLDVAGASVDQGAPVIQWSWAEGRDNELWQITEI